MADEGAQRPARAGPRNVAVFPIIGLLAVSTAVFFLLWQWDLFTGGRAQEEGGRRIEARTAGGRAFRITEGSEKQKLDLTARLAPDDFEKLGKAVAALADSKVGDERATALAGGFFESPSGQSSEPAVALAFPREQTTETLEVHALDLRRQLCYCRLGSTGQPLAVEAAAYRRVADKVANLAKGSAGNFAVPYYVELGEALRAKLAELDSKRRKLVLTTVAGDPGIQLTTAIYARERGIKGPATVRVDRPDLLTFIFPMRVSDRVAMAHALAEAMAGASAQVRVRHFDSYSQEDEVNRLARKVGRAYREIGDSLVIEYGARARVVPAARMAKQRPGHAHATTGRFLGEEVVLQALDGLLADRGRVYFAEGHEERQIGDAASGTGLARAAAALRANGFDVRPLDLAADGAMPGDCDILVVAGPRQPYTDKASNALDAHLKGGGKLVLLLDQPVPATMAKLLRRYGIELDPNVFLAKVELNRDADFVRAWKARQAAFVQASALKITPPPEPAPYEVVGLARAVLRDPKQAPVWLAAVVRPRGKGPKIVVFGTALSFSDGVILGAHRIGPRPGNLDLLVDAFTWLAE